jgi:hypothetical protein
MTPFKGDEVLEFEGENKNTTTQFFIKGYEPSTCANIKYYISLSFYSHLLKPFNRQREEGEEKNNEIQFDIKGLHPSSFKFGGTTNKF